MKYRPIASTVKARTEIYLFPLLAMSLLIYSITSGEFTLSKGVLCIAIASLSIFLAFRMHSFWKWQRGEYSLNDEYLSYQFDDKSIQAIPISKSNISINGLFGEKYERAAGGYQLITIRYGSEQLSISPLYSANLATALAEEGFIALEPRKHVESKT